MGCVKAKHTFFGINMQILCIHIRLFMHRLDKDAGFAIIVLRLLATACKFLASTRIFYQIILPFSDPGLFIASRNSYIVVRTRFSDDDQSLCFQHS
jgi:hypothetical protein